MVNRAAAVCVLATVALASCALGMQSQTAPAFVWSTTAHLACGRTGETSRVTYEVKDGDFWGGSFVEALFTGLVPDVSKGFLRPEIDSKPEILAVFLGSKLQTGHLSKLSEEEALQPLQNALKASASSLSIPHVDLKAGASSFVNSLMSTVDHLESTKLHRFGSCGPESVALSKEDMYTTIQQLEPNTSHVLLICADQYETVAEEMQVLADLTEVLSKAQQDAMVMYMSQPPAVRANMRLLQEKPVQKCGSECQAVVYAVEAAIIMFIILVAVMLGMTCHNMLDAPSRFEAPKQSD